MQLCHLIGETPDHAQISGGGGRAWIMVGMALTQIEQYAFGGNHAHFVTAFDIDVQCITVRLKPVEKDASLHETIVSFPSARMLDDWTDSSEEPQWPLDIIGFDCYPQLERWKFVLNCGTKEWTWESNWPTLEKNPAR